MTTQRDDTAGHGAADPARGQADPSEPMTGQIVPPPRADSEPGPAHRRGQPGRPGRGP